MHMNSELSDDGTHWLLHEQLPTVYIIMLKNTVLDLRRLAAEAQDGEENAKFIRDVVLYRWLRTSTW
jgi:hypothetical protein